MNVIEKICVVLSAPFSGVHDWLEENLESEVAVTILYLLWIILMGWMFTLGTLLTCAMVYVGTEEETEE